MDDPKALYSQQAEEALIGAVLINQGIIKYLDTDASEFYVQRNAWIWEGIIGLDKRGHEIDLITLGEELERRGHLQEVGGSAYISGLINRTPSSLGAESYARIIRDYAARRMVLRVANNLAKAAYDSDKSLDGATAEAIDELVSGIRSNEASVHISEVIDEIYLEVNERAETPKDIWGLETGFIDFDNATGGLQPGEVYYLAGEPGIGKSKLAVQMGINMGSKNIPGAIFSLEMGRKQLMRRSLSALAKVPTRNIKSGRMEDREWPLFAHACEEARSYPIYINDTAALTTSQFRAELARLVARHGVQWAVLDYLLLMGDNDGRDETEISAKLSRRVKSIAKSLDVAMITVNSVTKEGMDEGKTPNQRQIRGSGQVIHDADIIGILKKHIPGRFEAQNDKLRTHVFVKGRELEGLGYFHLVAFDKWPSFGNYRPEH